MWCGSNCVDLGSHRSASLIWVYTVCPHLSVRKLRNTLLHMHLIIWLFSEIKKCWQHVCENSHRQFLSSVSSASCKNFISITWAGPNKNKYRKNPKNSHTGKNCCNDPKISTRWLYHRVICLKDTGRMSNSADPDQTAPAPLGAVCSSRSSVIWVCTVCQDTLLSENLRSLWYASLGRDFGTLYSVSRTSYFSWQFLKFTVGESYFFQRA